jgi:hypothetical protein
VQWRCSTLKQGESCKFCRHTAHLKARRSRVMASYTGICSQLWRRTHADPDRCQWLCSRLTTMNGKSAPLCCAMQVCVAGRPDHLLAHGTGCVEVALENAVKGCLNGEAELECRGSTQAPVGTLAVKKQGSKAEQSHCTRMYVLFCCARSFPRRKPCSVRVESGGLFG